MTVCSCCSFYSIQLALIFPLHKFKSKNAGTVLVNVSASVTMLIIPPKILQVTMPTYVVEKKLCFKCFRVRRKMERDTPLSLQVNQSLGYCLELLSLAPQENILCHGPSHRITHLMICLPNTCQEEVIQMQCCLKFPVGALSI